MAPNMFDGLAPTLIIVVTGIAVIALAIGFIVAWIF